MCPICIISAIVLGSSVVSAGGINWLRNKLGGKDAENSGAVCQLFPQQNSSETAESSNSTAPVSGTASV